MSRVLSLFVIIVIFAASIAVAQNPVLDIGKCTDTLFCRSSSCTTQPVATSQCLDASNSSTGVVASQVLVCNPEVTACGELWTFSDKFCTVPLSSQAFVCGECSASKQQQIQCWLKNGVESLAVQTCDDSKCSTGCKTQQEIPRGQCVPTQSSTNGQTVYLQYGGSVMCNAVDQIIWEGSSTCKGTVAGIKQLPTQHCIAGTLLTCAFPNSTARRDRGSPCPYADVHKLECAAAIAECVAECASEDWEACAKCIVEKVAGGDLTECCQTVSYYAGFDCSDCNYFQKIRMISNSTGKH